VQFCQLLHQSPYRYVQSIELPFYGNVYLIHRGLNHSDMIDEDEAEASVPMHMSEVSEDTADDDLSSRYFCKFFSSFEFQRLICFLTIKYH